MHQSIIHLLPSISDVGLMACLSIAFGQLSRLIFNRRARGLIIGILFGGAAGLSAYYHAAADAVPLADSSPIYVGFAAAFLGSVGSLSSLVVAAGLSLALGAASWSGLSELLLACAAGASWSALMRGWDRRNKRALLMLGVLVTASLLPGYLWSDRQSLIAPGTGILVALSINLVIALLLGSFIERERTMLEGELQLRLLAETDSLTGLHNRRTIIQAFASRAMDNVGQALLLIDIDHFKSINDSHGHAAGDAVLKHIADQLRRSVRAGDIVSRYGGEEFAILLAAGTPKEALIAGERLRISIERERVKIGQLAVPVTASIGGVWWLGGADFDEKIEMADVALYRAKRAGRNCVVIHQTADTVDEILTPRPA